MKKLGQKAGAIGALLFTLIPAFFMAACSTDAAVDVAAVTAELNAEKGKYLTAVNLQDEAAQDEEEDVYTKVIKRAGERDLAITMSISSASFGLMELSRTESGAERLTIQKTENKDDGTFSAKPEAVEKEEWRGETQVVTLQFEKDGVTSRLNVLAAFGAPKAVAESTLIYGYDSDDQQKKAVLDLVKLNATGWISADAKSLSYTDVDAVAMLAAQQFIDDVLSGMTTGELLAGYGTYLKVKADPGPGDIIPLATLAETVKDMYPVLEGDANRQAVSASSWVAIAPNIVLSGSNLAKGDGVIKKDWINVGRMFTLDEHIWAGYMGYGVDMNQYAGGKYIYGIFQLTTDPTKAIADLIVIEGEKTKPPTGYEKIPVDLNQSAGGPYLYLCYRRVNENDKEAVRWLGAITKTFKITNKTPYDALEGYSVGIVPAVRDTLRWVGLNNPDERKNPADLNKGINFSSYVYMTQEKKAFRH